MFFQYTTLEGYCCANLGEMFGFRNVWGGFLAGEGEGGKVFVVCGGFYLEGGGKCATFAWLI